MRKINKIFIHHSASNFGDAKLIEKWHKERGFSTIGYHYIILNGYHTAEDYKKEKRKEEEVGAVEMGLDVSKAGIHVKDNNSDSIGICLIHNDVPYMKKQLEGFRNLTAQIAMIYGIKSDNILGHYEVDKNKPLCPSLDMNVERAIIKELMR